MEKESIINLIQKGISIPKIARETGVAKSTIYYHYKKIKGRRFKLVSIPDDKKVIGEFLGAFAGDGSYYFDKKKYHHTISIFLHAKDDKEYGYYLRNLIEQNFNKDVRAYYKYQKNELKLTFYSKKILNLITEYLNIEDNKTLNISLKKDFKIMPRDMLAYFTRGLIDTDGHVNKDGQIVIALISKNMILQLKEILRLFDIESKIHVRKVRPNEHALYELKMLKYAAIRYFNIIGFSNKRKEKNICTGRDLNSRLQRAYL